MMSCLILMTHQIHQTVIYKHYAPRNAFRGRVTHWIKISTPNFLKNGRIPKSLTKENIGCRMLPTIGIYLPGIVSDITYILKINYNIL